jgi:hypothetical protein
MPLERQERLRQTLVRTQEFESIVVVGVYVVLRDGAPVRNASSVCRNFYRLNQSVLSVHHGNPVCNELTLICIKV